MALLFGAVFILVIGVFQSWCCRARFAGSRQIGRISWMQTGLCLADRQAARIAQQHRLVASAVLVEAPGGDLRWASK